MISVVGKVDEIIHVLAELIGETGDRRSTGRPANAKEGAEPRIQPILGGRSSELKRDLFARLVQIGAYN